MPKQLLERQIIVTLAPASPEQWARITADLTQSYGLTKVGAFPLASIGVQCIVFQIPAQQSFADMLAQLEADPLVEAVQANQFFQSRQRVYNDPYAKLQYGVRAVQAARVHNTATGKGVTIAVIDTGVDTEHADLRGQIITTANFVDGGKENFTRDSHGTAVAGVIAARANNHIGVFGVAPNATIMALKACWHQAATSSQALCSSWTLARAVDFANQEGAQVLNFSLAGPPDPLLQRLLARSVALGITVVAATLEQPQGLGFPASLDTVIAVLSSDPEGNVNAPEQVGHAPLLAAPGIQILTTQPQHAYDFISGGSLAAAHVSGIAALLLERHPSLSPTKLQTVLQTTARPVDSVGNASTVRVGVVDACAALHHLLSRSACPSS